MKKYIYFLTDFTLLEEDNAQIFHDINSLIEYISDEEPEELERMRIYRVDMEDYRCPVLEKRVRGIEWD